MLKSFEEFLAEQQLDEAAITIGGKMYPKYNQVVIMAGGAGCFGPDTKVLTDSGAKRIADVVVGDKVWSLNETTNTKELQEVTNTFVYGSKVKPMVELQFQMDDGAIETVHCTEDHEFYFEGAYVQGVYVQAKDIELERHESNMKLIKRQSHVPDYELVHDIEVKGNHNYCITESSIVVHNSGKGFIKDNLLAVEGITFDVDELKKAVINSNKVAADIKRDTGVDVKKFNLKNPKDVGKLHDIVASHLRLDKKNMNTKFASIANADPRRKPNLIFDVTLKGLSKLESISRNVQELGYNKEDISIVWVVNDMQVAVKQNAERERQVPYEILVDTHEGASMTMHKILSMGDDLSKYMDGDIYLAFNKFKVDAEVVDSKVGKSDSNVIKTKKDTKGKWIKDANYVQVKKKGKPVTSPDKLEKEVVAKIKDYTPDIKHW